MKGSDQMLHLNQNNELKLEENKVQNHYGKISSLRLAAVSKKGKTVIDDLFFTAPFKIMSPFYDEAGTMKVMLLMASAGLMEGDDQEIEINVTKGTRMELLSQSYEKIHKMKRGSARRSTVIAVAGNAFLNYNPLPVIPYKDSSFHNRLEVELQEDTSEFQMCEILCCGRSACHESFDYHRYYSFVQVKKKGTLLYRDNTRFNPRETDMSGTGMYEGFTHLAMLLFFNIKKEEGWLEKVRRYLDERQDIEGGATRIPDGGYLVRILGNNAQELQKICQIISYIK